MFPITVVSEYERVVKPILIEAGLKEKSNKYHNNIFDDHVKFYLLLLKEESKKSYRDVAEFVGRNAIHRNLMLKKVPHFTTLQKFLQRLGEGLFREVVQKIYGRLKKDENIVGVDSTGIEIVHSSSHYLKRIEEEKTAFVKASLMVNTSSRAIADCYAVADNSHDIRMLAEHLKLLPSHGFSHFVADKAYDSNQLYWELKKMKVMMVVPQRQFRKEGFYTKTRGSIVSKKREKMFDERIYHQRSLVESVNSSIKRRFGSFVNSTRAQNMVKQVYLKAALYNLGLLRAEADRIVFLLLPLGA
jgi:transposase